MKRIKLHKIGDPSSKFAYNKNLDEVVSNKREVVSKATDQLKNDIDAVLQIDLETKLETCRQAGTQIYYRYYAKNRTEVQNEVSEAYKIFDEFVKTTWPYSDGTTMTHEMKWQIIFNVVQLIKEEYFTSIEKQSA